MSARDSSFYRTQYGVLMRALRAAGCSEPGLVAERFFRQYHGLQDREAAWRKISDAGVLRLAVGLWVTRTNTAPWRRLWCITLSEAARRNLLPTSDEFRVAWDICLAAGVVDAKNPPALIEVWVRAQPLLHQRAHATQARR